MSDEKLLENLIKDRALLDEAWESLMVENSYKLNRAKSIELMEKYQKIDTEILRLKEKIK